MAKKTPRVDDTKLTWFDEYTEQQVYVCDIISDWQVWLDWLDREKSFRFVAADGTNCSVIKEYRKFFGGPKKPVWYAHKRLGGKLKRRYIGVSENCTYKTLKAIAFDLCQHSLA